MHLPLKLPALTLTESRIGVGLSLSRVSTAAGREKKWRPRVARGLSLAQRKARQSQVPARHDLEEGDCYNRLAKLGGQAGCREGPHREGQGGALGELGHLSGRCSDREEPRHFGSSRTSAGRKG